MEYIFYMALMISENTYHPFAVHCKPKQNQVIHCQSYAPKTRYCLPAFPIGEIGISRGAKAFCKTNKDDFFTYEVVLE